MQKLDATGPDVFQPYRRNGILFADDAIDGVFPMPHDLSGSDLPQQLILHDYLSAERVPPMHEVDPAHNR